MKKHFPPVVFSLFISNSNRFQPAIRSVGLDLAFSQRHALTILAPVSYTHLRRASGNGSPGNNGFASHSMQPDAEGHLLLTDYEGKKIRVLDPALVNDDLANDASIDLDDLSLSPGFKPKTLALCGDRWYATGDNDAINIYERQSNEWSKKIKTVKGYAFSQPARIYAQNDSVLWVSDTHSSKRTLVKMLVHKGEIRE